MRRKEASSGYDEAQEYSVQLFLFSDINAAPLHKKQMHLHGNVFSQHIICSVVPRDQQIYSMSKLHLEMQHHIHSPFSP